MLPRVAFALLGFIAALHAVCGTPCSPTANTTTCVLTKYTTDVCNNATSTCKCSTNEFYPIRSGCGRKLDTPNVKTTEGNSVEVLLGKSAALTCNGDSQATSFEWYLNGNIISGATDKVYTITSASSTNTGNYSCKAKFSSNSALDSDTSSLVLIQLVPANGNLTILPQVSVSPPDSKVFLNKQAKLSCSSLPNGYDTNKIVYRDSTDNDISSTVNITNTNKQTSVKCVLTDQTALFQNTSSNTALLPDVSDTITSVRLSPSSYNTIVENVQLTCITSPAPEYVDTSANNITYFWKVNNTESSTTTSTYILSSGEGSSNIQCLAQYNGKNTTYSSTSTITKSSTYLIQPVISMNPTSPVIGSRLVVTCNTTTTDVLYTWMIGSNAIAGQYDNILQFDSWASSDVGVYTCTVTKGSLSLKSQLTIGSGGPRIVTGSLLVIMIMWIISKQFI